MLGRSSLLEREMRNKSGPSSSGNLRHFHKTLCSLSPPQSLWRKTGSGFSSQPPFFYVSNLVLCRFYLLFLLCRKTSWFKTRVTLLMVRGIQNWDMQWPKCLIRSTWCYAEWRSRGIILGGIHSVARKLWEKIYARSFLIVPGVWWLAQL